MTTPTTAALTINNVVDFTPPIGDGAKLSPSSQFSRGGATGLSDHQFTTLIDAFSNERYYLLQGTVELPSKPGKRQAWLIVEKISGSDPKGY